MITRGAQHVPDNIVETIVAVQDHGVGLRSFSAIAAASHVPPVPIVSEGRGEIRCAMNVITGHSDILIALPQDKGITNGVLIGTGLLPVGRSAGRRTRIVVVEAVVVRPHTSDTPLVHHREADVLEDIIFDQVVRGNEIIRGVMV